MTNKEKLEFLRLLGSFMENADQYYQKSERLVPLFDAANPLYEDLMDEVGHPETKETIDQETILDLMDKASLVGFDIHKLCDMIRAGKTEGQCYSEISKNIRFTFQGFPTIDDHDYINKV